MSGKTCLFCGDDLGPKGTLGAKSDEHIFAQWYLDRYGLLREKITVTVQEARTAACNEQGVLTSLQVNEFPVEREPSGKGFVHGRVCSACNNGWMSNLESKVAQIFTNLNEKNVNLEKLDIEQRVWLAKWAAKTAMVFNDCKPGPLHRFPDSVYRRMVNSKSKLPKFFHVFVGRMAFADPLFISNVPSFLVFGENKHRVQELAKRAVKVIFQMQRLTFNVLYWPHSNSTFSYNPELCAPLSLGSYATSFNKCPDVDDRFSFAILPEITIP